MRRCVQLARFAVSLVFRRSFGGGTERRRDVIQPGGPSMVSCGRTGEDSPVYIVDMCLDEKV